MEHSNVLDKLYTRIDILDLDQTTRKFSKRGVIYLLGDASKHVKSSDDINIKNKKLIAEIGLDAVKILSNYNQEIVGGDDWDELDEMDVEDLLNFDTTNLIQDSINSSNSHLDEVTQGEHITDYVLYSTDKSLDIRETIAVVSNIKPYKQYIWFPDQHTSLTSDNCSLMSYWDQSIRMIEGYPIDAHKLSELPDSQFSIQKYVKGSAMVLTCISLDSIIQEKSKLQMIARSDTESFELIHTHCILRFFPMMTISVFGQYLLDELLIESRFDNLYFDLQEATSRYRNRKSLLADLESQNKVTTESSDLLTVTTLGMTISFSYGDYDIRLDTIYLFQSMDITQIPNISTIDIFCLNENNSPVRLRKINQRDQYRAINYNNSVILSQTFKRSLFRSKSIVIYFLPRNEYESVVVCINQHCGITVTAVPNQTYSFSKAAFIEFLYPLIDPLLKYINSLELCFLSKAQFPYLMNSIGCSYQIPSSSSKLTFNFPISYIKLSDLIIDRLLSAGFVENVNNEQSRHNNEITSLGICYGVSINESTGRRNSSIDIRDINGAAVVILSNLDVDETNLYVDIIGRMIISSGKSIELMISDQTQLGVIDPILFRSKVSSDGYSRICQRKFQPNVTTKDDPSAVEYYNFTFQRPEYYSCPSKEVPILGFIQNKHDQGFCLPCCRKTTQPNSDNVRNACIINESTSDNMKTSTYKIEYPNIDVPNIKIINRRILLPKYIEHLFNIQKIIANGSLIYNHVDIEKDANQYLQTAIIIAAIDKGIGKPMYSSYMDLVLDIIGAIKNSTNYIQIMKNKLISDRYTTPKALIHAIEDTFLRNVVIPTSNINLSSLEWNDLIIFLSNVIGLNILLISDNREHTKGLELVNLQDIDITRPVVVLLRRIDIIWSLQHSDTRAAYIPITPSKFKIAKKSPLIIPLLNISNSLTKIKQLTMGTSIQNLSKQFTIKNLTEVTDNHKSYKVLDNRLDQKLVMIGIQNKLLMMTMSSIGITIQHKDIDQDPSASFDQLLTFISDYNTYFLNTLPKERLESYKQYLSVVLKTSSRYELIDLNVLLLKIQKLIVYNTEVIGVLIGLVDSKQVISTEMAFIKPMSIKSAKKELTSLHIDINAYHNKLNVLSILSFPLATHMPPYGNITDPPVDGFKSNFIEWVNHPLKISNSKCEEDLREQFNTGLYKNEIYNMFVIDILEKWKSTRISCLDDFIVKHIKTLGLPPVVQTKVDSFADNICTKFKQFDPAIVHVTLSSLFTQINTSDKTVDEVITSYHNSNLFIGFDLKNLHRLTKIEVRNKAKSIMNSISTITETFPQFDVDASVNEQLSRFYKTGKLLLHKDMISDLLDMFVSDLCNPFRREYILNMRLIQSTFADMKPHLGELIYVQQLDNGYKTNGL